VPLRFFGHKTRPQDKQVNSSLSGRRVTVASQSTTTGTETQLESDVIEDQAGKEGQNAREIVADEAGSQARTDLNAAGTNRGQENPEENPNEDPKPGSTKKDDESCRFPQTFCKIVCKFSAGLRKPRDRV